MTNLLIFVIFGIGLDDTFIITGAYFRTGHIKDTVERIERVMESVGLSILITSVTTTAAFFLGAATSSILPIRWLCLCTFYLTSHKLDVFRLSNLALTKCLSLTQTELQRLCWTSCIKLRCSLVGFAMRVCLLLPTVSSC
jgi:uncharacterized membrane protein